MISLRLVKPINDDDMGKTLNVLQAFFEFLEYLYPGNLVTPIGFIRGFSPTLVRRMDNPDGFQFQAMWFPHSSTLARQGVNPLSHITYLKS
jgi:hypothetical protein